MPVTWTLLSETALAGSTVIKLKQQVNWQEGDEVVIATTGGTHSQQESEVRRIVSLSDDKTIITLDDPLNYK